MVCGKCLTGLYLLQVDELTMHIPTYAWTSLAGWLSRIVIAISQLIVIRLLTQFLRVDDYAIFAILTGIAGWFSLADFGIGVGLQNTISELRAKNIDYAHYLHSIGVFVIVLFVLSFLFSGLLAFIVGPLVLKNFTHINEYEKMTALFIVSLLLSSASIGSIAFKIWFAEGRGYIANLVQALAAILSVLGLLALDITSVQNKLLISLVIFLTPNCLFAVGAVIFKVISKIKRGGCQDISGLKQIRRRSLSYWVFAAAAMGVVQVDYLVMSRFLMADDIATYNIVSKIYIFLFYIFSSVLAALWPVFAENISVGNWKTVSKFIRRILVIGIGFGLITAWIVSQTTPYLLSILAPGIGVNISVQFILLFGLYNIVRIWTDTFATVLQSANDYGVLLVAVPFQAVLSLCFQWYLVQKIGINGIVLGIILSFIFSVGWLLPLRVRLHTATVINQRPI